MASKFEYFPEIETTEEIISGARVTFVGTVAELQEELSKL